MCGDPHFPVYKEDTKEMEIGFPTDVKHVAHIGWDGSTTTNPVKGWESVHKPEVLFPSISLKQFEEAMAEQLMETQSPAEWRKKA
ncbi:hypothetical protein RJ640_022469 [Escallonia rubra]|uniref:CRIB domain-containing protein n=1 Tax=Escallonia rubra TaxID=112253 RepID=A0AA88RJM0_9ASTE|nr:hypothetical protein RJ640_022469 [Escallonia rubra]